MKKRIIKQLREEIFKCRRRMHRLTFTKKGAYKPHLDTRDIRASHRMSMQLMRIMLTNGEGRYLEPNEKEKYEAEQNAKLHKTA